MKNLFNDLFEPEENLLQPVKTELLEKAVEKFELRKKSDVRELAKVLIRDAPKTYRRSVYAE
jgi:hypothetical protein